MPFPAIPLPCENTSVVKAKNSFLTTVENKPEHIDAWLELGQMAEEQKDKIAEIYYKNALLINKNNKEVMHYLAFYYQNNDKLQEALNIYSNIIINNPTYSAAYLNSGIIYLNQDSIEQAFNNFNLLVNIDKSNPKFFEEYERGYRKIVRDHTEKILYNNPIRRFFEDVEYYIPPPTRILQDFDQTLVFWVFRI